MAVSWRPSLVAALVLTLLPAGAAADPLDRTALEELEGLLQELGFDPGPVDGVVDAETTAAIRRYQDFALLTGTPEPSERLLDELRGVAAAFAALNAASSEAPTAQPEKAVVPPPPPPPKLTAPDEAPKEALEEVAEPAEQMAALPPPAAEPPLPGDSPAPSGMTDSPPTAMPGPRASPEAAADPAAALQARIDAALLRFLHRLNDGSLTREALARQFNAEGRSLLQQAQYDEAIFKFSVAIHLDPAFAGAYANRGTAYRHQKESALAKVDFDKAKELGFASFRAKGASNPLN